jgi:hypothetical protein
VIPFFEVEIDYGEKNRLHVEKLLREDKKKTTLTVNQEQVCETINEQLESELEDN